MCCCYLRSCCCNCASLKTGVVIWAIFDMIFNMSIYAIVSFVTRTENLVKTPFSWGLVTILADLGLSCGAYSENICVVVFWQVIYMINIIVLCAIFAILTILVSKKVKHQKGCSKWILYKASASFLDLPLWNRLKCNLITYVRKSQMHDIFPVFPTRYILNLSLNL